MNSKIILVTGANKGIGLEIVKQLATGKHTVLLAARNVQKGDEAVEKLKALGLPAHFIQLEVTNAAHIQSAAEKIKSQFGKLDVLINNAAIMNRADASLLKTDETILRDTIETNAIAPLKITQAFVPLMPAGARVIMVSSTGGSMTDIVGGWCPVYCISKSMLNAATRHLAYYLANKKISVNAMCPGWVQTDMGGSGAPRKAAEGAATALWLATDAPQHLTGKFFRDRKEIPW
jgi:NAD(P)-dependent dehydrogenase (short-subunit alcohol dehydrogenase family)